MNRRLLAVLALVVTAGCAHELKVPETVWPLPPDKPRVRFVTAFGRESDVNPSTWRAFTHRLFGGSEEIHLVQPTGLALSPDGNRLYIADYGSGLVIVTDFKERTFRPVNAKGEAMKSPFAVAVDDDENVYVTEQRAQVVAVLDRSGRRIREFGAHEKLEKPTGIAIDRRRKIVYVVDGGMQSSTNHRVLAYALDGRFLRQVGRTRGDAAGQFHFPSYAAVDSDGNLYVADTLNFRIQVFDPDGNLVSVYGEQGDGPGTFARLKGIALDSSRNLYAVDSDHNVVQMFTSKWESLMYFGGNVNAVQYMNRPSPIAIDTKRNRVYVANLRFCRVNVYDLLDLSMPSAAPSPPPAGTAPNAMGKQPTK